MIRILCLVCILLGAAVMVFSTVRYGRFLRRSREESYTPNGKSRQAETLAFLAMLFFIAGFVVGGVDVLLRDVAPIFLFVCVVFLVGAVFIGAMVQVQIAMVDRLRERSMQVMHSFVKSIEMKDAYTQGHSWHVYHIVKRFYRQLPPPMRQELNGPKLLDAALLHDVGKMGVADNVLNKQGPLTDAEWEAIKTHPAYGKQMLEDTCFAELGDWVLYHHERVDGTGYYRLPGEEVPLASKIIAVADTYSAMTTDREYRPSRSHNEALAIMREVAGSQLDAELVRVFATIEAEALRPQPAVQGKGA